MTNGGNKKESRRNFHGITEGRREFAPREPKKRIEKERSCGELRKELFLGKNSFFRKEGGQKCGDREAD